MTEPLATIRDFQQSDGENVVALLRELQAAEVPMFDRKKPVDAIGLDYVQAIKQDCDAHRGRMIVAERDGRIIGFAALLTEKSSIHDIDEVLYTFAEVSELVVTVGERRTGLGRQLLRHCETLAIASGARWLRVDALAKNDPARSLYTSFGFTEALISYEKPLL
jgi:GNAT superfamily N-acetyltransferase